MRPRSILRFEPSIERFEDKQLLSGGVAAAHHSMAHERASAAVSAHPIQATNLPHRFYAFRITNPSGEPVDLKPPFQQVLVQATQPVPGQVYNVLSIAVKNGTAQTFDASNDFTVRLTTQSKKTAFPILTGSEQWKSKQWIVFYVLTKKYYPVPEVAGGFKLNLGGASSTLVPGPSGIFLRLKYDPATFPRTLDSIVAYGQGAQGGDGAKVGMPDTAINEIVAASTHRIDFGGHF